MTVGNRRTLKTILMDKSKWMQVSKTLNLGGGSSFIPSVLVANIPQLVFSFWYRSYNSLITQLEMSREWDQFSTAFCPLRVTEPK